MTVNDIQFNCSNQQPSLNMVRIIEPDRILVIKAEPESDLNDSLIIGNLDFSKETHRLQTLIKFNGNEVNIEQLARFGFYLKSPPDDVECYFCKVAINNWGIGDDPLYEHYVHADGKCPFLNNVEKTDNIQIGPLNALVDELTRFNNLVRRIKQSKPIEEAEAHSSKQSYLPIPRHPDFADFETRLKSFQNWPKEVKQTPEELSEAGFFYIGPDDSVKCFSCEGCLENWQPNDSVLEEHRKHFSNRCHFINTFYGHIKRKLSKSNRRPFNATPEQIMCLISFMDEHTDLRDHEINSLNHKQLYNEMWRDVAEKMNLIEGPKKTIESWKGVWRNLKYNQKRRVSLKVEKDGGKLENRRETTETDSSQCYSENNTLTSEKLETRSSSPPQNFTIIEVNSVQQPLSPESQESTDKVLPKKRKLQKCLLDNENSESIALSTENDTMQRERKIEKLEFKKMQYELDNGRREWEIERQQLKLEIMSKQLEIEKLKSEMEIMIVKREIENEKEELQKERKKMNL